MSSKYILALFIAGILVVVIVYASKTNSLDRITGNFAYTENLINNNSTLGASKSGTSLDFPQNQGTSNQTRVNRETATAIPQEPVAQPKPPVAKTPDPLPSPTSPPEPLVIGDKTPFINLSATQTSMGIYFEWGLKDVDNANGYKLVKNKTGSPKYPTDDFVFIENKETKHYTWTVSDGSTWHFRLCTYNGKDSCKVYSNEVTIKAPKITGTVKSITLTGTKDGTDKINLEWTVDGKSDLGYKIIWSKNEEPTYPTRDGDTPAYVNTDDIRKYTISNLTIANKYYIRVCEYINGKCGKYSNQVSIEL